MAYFKDLTEYTYSKSVANTLGTKNVGWLGSSLDFDKMNLDDELLDLVWAFCTILVAQTRGFHDCALCPPHTSNVAERKGQKLSLGSAEIRVFSGGTDIFAAPNLIYHYMSVHCYRPPEAFITALRTGPRPPTSEYFDHLSKRGLAWNETSAPASSQVRFKFVKTEDGVKIVYE
jgi:hypothetical protein